MIVQLRVASSVCQNGVDKRTKVENSQMNTLLNSTLPSSVKTSGKKANFRVMRVVSFSRPTRRCVRIDRTAQRLKNRNLSYAQSAAKFASVNVD